MLGTRTTVLQYDNIPISTATVNISCKLLSNGNYESFNEVYKPGGVGHACAVIVYVTIWKYHVANISFRT